MSMHATGEATARRRQRRGRWPCNRSWSWDSTNNSRGRLLVEHLHFINHYVPASEHRRFTEARKFCLTSFICAV